MATPIIVNPTQPSQVVVNGTQKSGTPITINTDLDYTRVQSMIDEAVGDVNIDTTELAKQGDNPEATNSAIYGILRPFETIMSEIDDGKKDLASAITRQGIHTEQTDSLHTMSENVDKILAGTSISMPSLILSDAANERTDISDTTSGWECVKSPLLFFPNLKNIRLLCEKITDTSIDGQSVENLDLPLVLTWIISGSHGQCLVRNTSVKELILPRIENMAVRNPSNSWLLFGDLPECEIVRMPKLIGIPETNRTGYSLHYFGSCKKLREVHFDSLVMGLQTADHSGGLNNSNMAHDCPRLILFEIGDGYKTNLYLVGWKPVEALRTDTTSEDYIELRTDISLANNLEQFLVNFKSYIADRLMDRNGQATRTITLSQVVRDVLTDEIVDIIISKNWVISPAKTEA